jgi:hypothetical protein
VGLPQLHAKFFGWPASVNSAQRIPLLIRKIRSRHLMIALLTAVIGAHLLRILLHATFSLPGMASWVLMPPCEDALCLGALAALLVRNPAFWL